VVHPAAAWQVKLRTAQVYFQLKANANECSDDAQIAGCTGPASVVIPDVLLSMFNLRQRRFASQSRILAALILGLAVDDANDFALTQLDQLYLQENDGEAK